MHAKILLAAVILSGQVYAQSTTTSTDATKPTEAAKPFDLASAIAPLTVNELKTFQYMKEHFSATYHGEYYFVRHVSRDTIEAATDEDLKIKDFKLMHNPTLIYKPTQDWQILSTAEFKYSDQPDLVGPAYPNTFYRALFTITRKNILNEKDHGVQLDAGIGRRVFNAGVAGLPLGNDRVFTTLTKNYGKSNGSLFIQYLYNDVKKSTVTTWKHSLELIPSISLQLTNKLNYLFNDDIVINTPKYKNRQHDLSFSHEMNVGYVNYQWTDKINTYYQLKYYHTDLFDQPAAGQGHLNTDYFEHYVGVGYAFTPKITLTGEVGNEIFASSDGRDFFAKKAKYPEFAIYLDAAL
ncbi:MAG: hypothetical protein ACXVLQ_16965 [Bacteriovorax sp.]